MGSFPRSAAVVLLLSWAGTTALDRAVFAPTPLVAEPSTTDADDDIRARDEDGPAAISFAVVLDAATTLGADTDLAHALHLTPPPRPVRITRHVAALRGPPVVL